MGNNCLLANKIMFISPEGDEYKKKKGTRLEVYHSIAYCGGSKKNMYIRSDLELNELGKVVLIKKDWEIHQIDIEAEFLERTLNEKMYVILPKVMSKASM